MCFVHSYEVGRGLPTTENRVGYVRDNLFGRVNCPVESHIMQVRVGPSGVYRMHIVARSKMGEVLVSSNPPRDHAITAPERTANDNLDKIQ